MSHIVQVQAEVRDARAVTAACQRLGLPQPVAGTAQLFAGAVTGLLVRLPGWQYPVVCQLGSGQLAYDNYGGLWGQFEHLDRFRQAYAVERAKLEARRQGHAVTEQALPDGSIRLAIQVGGGA